MINVQTFFFTHIASDLEYGLHGVGVATRELALDDWAEQMCKPRQMFEDTTKVSIFQIFRGLFCKKNTTRLLV